MQTIDQRPKPYVIAFPDLTVIVRIPGYSGRGIVIQWLALPGFAERVAQLLAGYIAVELAGVINGSVKTHLLYVNAAMRGFDDDLKRLGSRRRKYGFYLTPSEAVVNADGSLTPGLEDGCAVKRIAWLIGRRAVIASTGSPWR